MNPEERIAPIYTPPLKEVRMPDPAIYAAIGHDGIQRMLRDLYRLLAKSPISGMFPAGEDELMAAADKSALFWTTMIGGPPLYQQKFGHPRMRQRHFPFHIDYEAREHWLACWYAVLENAETYGFPKEHLQSFRNYIDDFSEWMVNS